MDQDFKGIVMSTITHDYNNNNQSDDSSIDQEDQLMDDLRRGPWTVEEDLLLVNYIANHGEGRWNSLARCAGLKRTGKSCRLRWLNYLRPDVRRGNITLEEQLLILELHSRWGNRWSKIAQHLPGRTDNEIKNYWRTRVQKHAKQLQCDVNSKQFKDTMRYLWMPRLVERIQAEAASTATTASSNGAKVATANSTNYMNQPNNTMNNGYNQEFSDDQYIFQTSNNEFSGSFNNQNFVTATPENSSTGGSSDSMGSNTQLSSDCYSFPHSNTYNITQNTHTNNYSETLFSPNSNYYYHQQQQQQASEFQGIDQQQNNNNNMWLGGGEDVLDNIWNSDDMWFIQQQLSNDL
ncbi:hypothetical protein MKX03_013498 [Papaver bracteatum]|nr:hypothetical protein MKX03_013498 [Papaver bracteatum]